MGPEQFFCLVTAAVLWRMPLSRSLLTADVDVGVFAPRRNPSGRHVRGHAVRPELASIRIHPTLGVRITSPASTWAMLAAVIPDFRDVVALGDAVVREPMFRDDPPALATVPQLQAVVDAGRRVGIGVLREALPLIRTRSASPRETWCRLALADADLPEPELNYFVFDENGILVACVDLAYPRLKIAVEYEGEHHLTDPDQWAKDIERHARLVDLGWVVIRVTKRQSANAPLEFTGRVRRAITARS